MLSYLAMAAAVCPAECLHPVENEIELLIPDDVAGPSFSIVVPRSMNVPPSPSSSNGAKPGWPAPAFAASHCHRVLKAGGRLLVNVPIW